MQLPPSQEFGVRRASPLAHINSAEHHVLGNGPSDQFHHYLLPIHSPCSSGEAASGLGGYV